MCILTRCHGQKDNVVYELAKDLDVLEHSDPEMGDENMNFVLSDGEPLSPEINRKLVALMTVLDVDDEDDCNRGFGYAELVKSK